MAAHRISVRRVLELDVPLTWQEAVAVTHEAVIVSLVHEARHGAPARIDVDACVLTRGGDVELPLAGPAGQPEAAWHLLRELLAGRETPADLEAMVYGTPAGNVSDELAMFSRPNRRGEIARLAARALEADDAMARFDVAGPGPIAPPAVVTPPAPVAAATPAAPPPAPPFSLAGAPQSAIDEPVARLREEVAARPHSTPSSPPARRSRPVLVQAAAAVLLVTAGVAAWWTWSTLPPSAPPAPSAEMPDAAAAVALDPAWASTGRREADIELGATRPVAAAVSMGGAVAPGAAATPVAAASGVEPVTDVPRPIDEPAATAPPGPSDAEIEALFADESIYSGDTPAVEPPVLLLPRMPKSAFLAPGIESRRPVVEVLVNQQGGVDAVRLRGQAQPGQTLYHARMMLSAAKAWEFSPARLEGKPVRYVMRVLLEP
jgi:hypothetical protein